MYNNKKIVVVMPAYNAEEMIQKTHDEIVGLQIVDLIIIVDDASSDNTVEIAKKLPNSRVLIHPNNKGYGGNQKTCYKTALQEKADIVVMVHPDYQYTPKLIPSMVSLIESGLYHCVLGSRILGGYALNGGMPVWKYVANRFLTMFANILVGAKLSEYHTGYRAFSKELLLSLDLEKNSDDFVFDNQMLLQILWNNFTIAEISCPTKYFEGASSINLQRSIKYGFGCVQTAIVYFLAKRRLINGKLFKK